MRQHTPQTSTGLLIAVAGAALFAVNGNVSKIVLLEGLSSLQLVSIRSAGAALILLAITATTRRAALRVGRGELGFLVLYGVTGIAMVQWLYFVAIARMPVGIALLFEYTAPIMVALWVRFVQKQPVRSRLWIALALALAGLGLVAQFWKGLTLDPIGLVSALGAGAALACYYLMGEHGQQERDPISLMGFSFGFSAIMWAVISPWWTFPFDRTSEVVDLPGFIPGQTPLWGLVLWIIVLGTVAPFLLVLLAMNHLGPARVGLVGMLEPVGAGLIAWVLLGESLTAVQVAGSMVVLAGIMLAETARQKPAQEPPGRAGADRDLDGDGDRRDDGADGRREPTTRHTGPARGSPLPEGVAP